MASYRTLEVNPEIWDRYRILWHILFWVGYVLIYSIVHNAGEQIFWEDYVQILIQLPLKIAATYAILYFFMPNYLYPEKIHFFVLLTFFFLLVISVLQWWLVLNLVYPLHDHTHEQTELFSWVNITKHFIGIAGIAGFAAGIKLLKNSFHHRQNAQQLQKEKLQSELKYLKAQLNPHILFNTLNSLYALALKKSEKTPDVILKLSDLLDYILYECSAESVSLKKEWEIIHTYIALEKIRYGDRVEITLEQTGDISNKKITPLLILPLIENAFKHGVHEQHADSWITINLIASPDRLKLTVANNFRSKTKEDNNGIGLENLRQRCELLHPGDFNLETRIEKDIFHAILEIPYSS